MSIDGIGGIGAAHAFSSAKADADVAASGPADTGPAAYFDMTGWTGPAEAGVTVGPLGAKADLAELSASVLSAVLR